MSVVVVGRQTRRAGAVCDGSDPLLGLKFTSPLYVAVTECWSRREGRRDGTVPPSMPPTTARGTQGSEPARRW